MFFLPHITAVLLLHLSSFALGQQITFINPTPNTPILQCGQVSIAWNGGVSPYTLSISTTSDATLDSVEVTPVVRDTTSLWVVDFPAGTPFTISISDGRENSATTPVLTVQPSSNTTCLDGDVADPSQTTIHPAHGGQTPSSTGTSVSPSQTNNNATPVSTRTAAVPSGSGGGSKGNSTNSSGTTNTSSHPHVAAIAGIAIAVIVILVVVALLFFLKLRRDRRRNYATSRDNLVAAFGRDKAGLDDAPAEEVDELAIPDPYVYHSIIDSRNTDLVSVAEEGLSHNPMTTTSNSRSNQRTSGTTSTDGTNRGTGNMTSTTTASRESERYLPNFEEGNPNNPGASSNLRMQEEDIDRLAARMVALMSSGRMSDQAWSPAPRDGRDKDILLEDMPAPPLYNEVTMEQGRRPRDDVM